MARLGPWGSYGPVCPLAGCGGYESNFSCKGYPDQATCESVSEAYEKRFAAGQKVTQYTKDQKDASHDTSGQAQGLVRPRPPMVFSGKPDSAVGKPVITPASALRVTVFPWKDTKKRLHDQSRHYLIVDEPDFIFGHMAQGVSPGSSSGHGKDLYPRMGRMVEKRDGKRNSQWERGGERHDGEHSGSRAALGADARESSWFWRHHAAGLSAAPQSGGANYLTDDGQLPPQ
jgi:type IV conjugative transfer system lipoprotein TraV